MKKKSSKLSVTIKWVFLAMEDTRLSLGARCLAARIYSLSRQRGHCWAKNYFLAESLGCSKPTITRWLKELKDHNYIEVEVLQSTGNDRKIIPKNPIITSDETPMITDDSTSTHTESDSSITENDSHDRECSDPPITDAQHNNKKEQEESNEMKEQKNGDVDVGMKDDEINAQISELENFDGSHLSPFPNLTKNKRISFLKKWRKILLSGKRLHEMDAEDQILVLLCLYSLLGRTMYDYEYGAQLLRKAFEDGKNAEAIFTAMWRLHNSKFAVDGKQWKNGWNLEYICSKERSIDWIHNNYPINAPSEKLEETIRGVFELVVSLDRWPRDSHVVKFPSGRLERM